MQAIRVSYLSATNTRPSRLVATNGRERRIYSYDYEQNDDHNMLNAANRFVAEVLPYAPELNPVPCQFKNDNYFSFIPRTDPDKLDEIMTKIYHATTDKITRDGEQFFTISKTDLEEILNKII